MPLTDIESTQQNITESSPDPDVLHIPYWTSKPHPVADPDPFRATGTLWLISKIGNLAMKSETVHMRPVNQDAAHLQALSLPREDLQAATQAEAAGRGQGAEGRGQRSLLFLFPFLFLMLVAISDVVGWLFATPTCHKVSPPPSFSSTRGSQETVAEGEKGSLCYVQSHSRLMLCHKIARLNPRYGDKKCLSSFSLPPRVFPRFPFAVIFSSAFFRFFPLWVCLTFAQRRREEGGKGTGTRRGWNRSGA